MPAFRKRGDNGKIRKIQIGRKQKPDNFKKTDNNHYLRRDFMCGCRFCIVFLPKIIAQNQHGKNETVRFEGYIVDQFDEGIADVAIYVNDLSQGKTDAFGRFTLSAVELNSTVKFRSENPDVIISTPIIKVTQAYSRTEGEIPSGYVVRAEIIGKLK